MHSERGSATIEHAALGLLIALAVTAGIAALTSAPPSRAGPELGAALARKLRCAPMLPGHCWRDPLTLAYGRSLAGAVRALAPRPAPGPGGLLPVDFRRCRRPSCALPGERFGLTASNRRVALFTSVADRRRAGEAATISYWGYRPGVGWSRFARPAPSALVGRLASTPLLEATVPRLIPLETLDGRNHVRFAAGEEPPWRWRVESRFPDIPPP